MTKMTSTQRIMMSVMGQEPDRVPVASILADWAWGQVYGPDSFLEYSLDPERLSKVVIWSCKEMGFDAGSITPDTQLIWEAIADASGLSPYPTLKWKDFCCTHPHRLYEGDPIKETMYGNPLVKTLKDAQKLKPADPYKHGRLPVILKTIELVTKELKGEYPLLGEYDCPVHVGACLMGLPQMFIAMQKDLELWKTVEKVIVDTLYEFVKAQIKVGVNLFGGPLMLPHSVGSEAFLKNPVWVEADFPLGVVRRIWEEFQAGFVLHPCSVGPFEAGIEAYKTFLGPCVGFAFGECGGADALARAKKQLAPATVIGNMHPVDLLLHGTPSEVEEAAIELIKKCGPGGHYILAAGCALPKAAPIENVQAMIAAANKYGKYPIIQ
ncbi:MAG TPA: uroporphyrinogen decarboxylase family protein [Thermodesulfobacteriota bacterium]|nr:uroporphyrinogen decarboxylase family protein [Thermodesulfobacteriota bacterium]